MFKNAIVYRLTANIDKSLPPLTFEEDLFQLLGNVWFEECKPLEIARSGFTYDPALPQEHAESPVVKSGDAYLITFKKEEKIIPPAFLNQAVKDRVSDIEKQQARKVYSKEKLAIKDELIVDLLPRAFSKHTITRAMILPKKSLIIVDAGTFTQAEALLDSLRNALGTLPLMLPRVKASPSVVMSNALRGELESPFEIHDKATLSDLSEDGGTIKITGEDLRGDDVIAHLDAGYEVTSLAAGYDDGSFTLNGDLRIKGIKLPEELGAQISACEDPLASLQTRLFLTSQYLVEVYEKAVEWFDGEVAPQ